MSVFIQSHSSNVPADAPSPLQLLTCPTSGAVSTVSPGCEQPGSAVFSASCADVDIAFLPVAVIEYLHSVSSSEKWQDVVSEFIAFKKDGPPTGVSGGFGLQPYGVQLDLVLDRNSRPMLAPTK